jgi:cyclopropane fatty-acyl-phospholipid synthase-like methyltransferase
LSNTLSPENTLRVWELLLGKHGFYSAAEFDPAHKEMNLREACLRKVESIRRLLVTSGVTPNKDTTFADLGCGWGSMIEGALTWGISPRNITAMTTSPHQINFLSNCSTFEGVHVVNHDIIEGDLPQEQHDVVLTIGGVEHTPPERMKEVFESWASSLKPGGRMVLEFFCDNPDSPLVAYDHPGISQTSLLAQLIFTGATVRAASHYEKAWTDAGLKAFPETYQKLPPYFYARTMRAWADNLESHKQEVLAMSGGLGVWNHMMTYLVLGEWVFANEMFETRRVVLTRASEH